MVCHNSFYGTNPFRISVNCGEEINTSNTNIARTVNIKVPTMASIFLKPKRIINSNRNTSNTVINAPTISGMPKIKSKTIALPITSAISVAMIANSAIIQKTIAMGLLKNDVSFVQDLTSCYSNLTVILCNNIAAKLEIKITNSKV